MAKFERNTGYPV